MKTLLDTNIFIDIALERQPFLDESEQVLSLVEQGLIQGYISATAITDIYYIVRRARDRNSAISFLQKILMLCQVAVVTSEAILLSVSESRFLDFEDAVQYYTAEVNQLDAIVTRNPQDFITDGIQILSPGALIRQFPNME